jgi:uncharacterized protein
VKSEKEYIIPFIGLKLGVHEFEFEIHDAFFEAREYSIIQSGNVTVALLLEKKETMLIGNFTLTGIVTSTCDRCNDVIEVPVKGDFRLVYKFGLEISDDESLIVLHPDSYEIDLRDTLYEFITISLPARIVHPQGTCNPEMLELLDKYLLQNESEYELDDEDDDWDEEE